jgi:hypothetical protein
VRDVTHFPPGDWDLQRRREYLDWTDQVVRGCRGTNAALESYYDEVLRTGRNLLSAPSAAVTPPIELRGDP